MQVRGKIAIVTGASSGIGLALAKLLTQKGAKVALASRSRGKLKKISESLPGSFFVSTDMTKEDDIREMVRKTEEHFGRIDILVNNAGQGYDSPVEKINLDFFRKIFELDLVGPIIAMQTVIPIMRRESGGAIINISSGTALMFLPNMGPYSSLKRALVNISLTAREELKEDNIKISVVYPYVTLTDFEKNTIREDVQSQEEETEEDWVEGLPYSPDTAKYVAEKILAGIKSGEAEIFAHDWMKPKTKFSGRETVSSSR